LESKDIRLHDRENAMRGEGGGEDKWWPETLYESHKLPSKQRKLYPFMTITKADLWKP
jgi:hypothetical protein